MKAFSHLILLLLAIAVEGSSEARMGGNLAQSVVKTIKSEDGDIVDCVDIYKQPAFDHPKLKNHIIQMSSTQHANIRGSLAVAGTPIQQAWQRSGSCPQGTIPILRTQNKEPPLTPLLQANGDVARKTENALASDNHGPFVGVSGTVQVWRAHVEPNEFSMNVIACLSLKANQSIQDYIGVGTGVDIVGLGDNNTRLIIYWNKDNENLPWCYNLKCPGFVQTTKEIALGSVFPNVSVYGDPERQYGLDAAIYLDQNLQRWWVAIKNHEVGYYPMEIFTNFRECHRAMWGGIVLDSKLVPSRTQMGNGHYSQEGPTKTGAIQNALVHKRDGGIVRQPPSGYVITRPQCYDLKDLGPAPPKLPGNYFLYGGPGSWNPNCF